VVSETAEAERTKAARIANGEEFVAREHEQRISAFNLIERVAEGAFQIVRGAARYQVHDDFGIAGGLENRAAVLEAAAQFGGVSEIAVVRQRQLAFIAIDDDGLRVGERSISGRGITCVSGGRGAGKPRENARLEDLLYQAHALLEMHGPAIGRDDPG